MSEDKAKNWKKIKEESEIQEEEMLEEAPSSEDDTVAIEHPTYAILEEQLTLAEQKSHENWEKAMRAVAELENVRRRTERDVTSAHRYGLEKIISSLLPVIDSLEQAMQLAVTSGQAGMEEGLQLTLKLFIGVLEKHDVQPIDPQGELFNPQEHEAMSMQEIPGALPNSIVTVFQKGYKLNDRVIRPARVIVAKTA